MKHFPLILCLLWSSLPLQAQDEEDRHEISLYGMGGKLSYLQYSNAGAGAGYTFFFHPHWSLNAGIEITKSSVTLAVEDISGSVAGWYYHGDGRQEVMETLFATEGLAVSPHIIYLNIPASLQFHTGAKHKFYTSLGVKAGFAQTGNYQITAENIRTKGFFPASGQTFSDMSNHHFVTISKLSLQSRLKQNFNYALLWEGGMRWKLKNGMSVYTGIYFDYGFPNIMPKQVTIPIEDIKNVLPGEVLDDPEYLRMIEERTTVEVDEANLIAAGIKVKFAFSVSSNPFRTHARISLPAKILLSKK
jgi:hypothetical protein